MKILITGGAGFIGSHIADLLIEKGHSVSVIDNLSTGKKENVNIRANFYLEDVLNYNEVREVFRSVRPEVVYHLAGQINVRSSVEDPLNDANLNILSTLKLLKLCKEFRVNHFIFASSGGVIYGDTREIPTSESHFLNPCSPYGVSKLTAEKYIDCYKDDLKYTVLRFANVYGPRQNSKGEAGVVAVFFDQMLSGETPVIQGGVQTRDFVYVKDVAEAGVMVLDDKKSDIYNISTGIETDIIGIFSRLNRYFYNKFVPEYIEMKKGDQKKSCLDYGKIEREVGWKPRTSLDDGLDKTYVWFLMERKRR